MSYLDDVAKAAHKQLELLGGDPLKLPPVLQPIVLLYIFQAMVDNGGFRYPMGLDFPFQPPYSAFVQAYRTIGADDAADALEKAVALFPFEEPHKDAHARSLYMTGLGKTSEFEWLSDLVCGDERVWTLLEHYAETHIPRAGQLQ